MDRYLHAFSTTADRKLYLRTKYLEPFVSATTTESSGAAHVAHYQNVKEEPGWDGRIWAYYNVTDVENPTTVLYTTTNISDMIVDGESVTPATTYTFDTEGEHLIKFALSGTTITAGSSTSALGLFGNCVALTNVVIPDTIVTIGAYSFYGCTNLTTTNIPNSVTSIGNSSFRDCSSLNGVTFPSSIITIGSSAFQNCSSLTGDIVLDNVTSIGASAFAQSNISSFINTKSCTFGATVFSGCKNITSINIKTGTINQQLIVVNVNTSSNYAESLIINGNLSNILTRNGDGNSYFNKVTINGNVTTSFGTATYIKEFRVNGNITGGGGGMGISYPLSTLKFFEVNGDILNAQMFYGTINGLTYHLGYNNVVTVTPANLKISNTSKIYVGDGSSQAADQAILDLYLADTNWSAYSSKLDLWYNYTGEYKTT